jgi:chromosome segregation ATPase
LIEKEYAKQSTADTDASVQYFAKYEPGERDDELFSVIATQFKTIDPALEKFYARYFNDRQQLVTLYEKYSSVFTNLENQANKLYDQINQLDAKIKADTADYNTKSAQLQADVADFNSKAQSGNMTQAQYTTQKASIESRIDALEAERTTINDEISRLNDEISQYNALNVQFQSLNQSINSTLSPTPNL